MENYSVEDVLPYLNTIKIMIGEKWESLPLTTLYFKNTKGSMLCCSQITSDKVAASKLLNDCHVGYYAFDSFSMPVEKMTEIFKSARISAVDLAIMMHNDKFIQEITIIMSRLDADVLLAFHKYIQYNMFVKFDYSHQASLSDITGIENNVKLFKLKIHNTFCYDEMTLGFVCRKEEEEVTEDGDYKRVMFSVSHNSVRLFCNIEEGLPILDKWSDAVGLVINRNLETRAYTGSIDNSKWKDALTCLEELDEAVQGLQYSLHYHLTTPLY